MKWPRRRLTEDGGGLARILVLLKTGLSATNNLQAHEPIGYYANEHAHVCHVNHLDSPLPCLSSELKETATQKNEEEYSRVHDWGENVSRQVRLECVFFLVLLMLFHAQSLKTNRRPTACLILFISGEEMLDRLFRGWCHRQNFEW